MSIYALLALGICYVLLIGGAELSAGSIVGITGMTFVVLMRANVPFVLTLIITIALGTFVGLCNGFMVAKMKMIPFIATLGMQYICRGFCQIIANGQSISLRTAVTDDAPLQRLHLHRFRPYRQRHPHGNGHYRHLLRDPLHHS